LRTWPTTARTWRRAPRFGRRCARGAPIRARANAVRAGAPGGLDQVAGQPACAVAGSESALTSTNRERLGGARLAASAREACSTMSGGKRRGQQRLRAVLVLEGPAARSARGTVCKCRERAACHGADGRPAARVCGGRGHGRHDCGRVALPQGPQRSHTGARRPSHAPPQATRRLRGCQHAAAARIRARAARPCAASGGVADAPPGRLLACGCRLLLHGRATFVYLHDVCHVSCPAAYLM